MSDEAATPADPYRGRARVLTVLALLATLVAVAAVLVGANQHLQDRHVPVGSLGHDKPLVVVMGDESGGGASATSWPRLLAAHYGWQLVDFTVKGTGYATDSTSCGLLACPSFPRVLPQVVALKPALVIVTGGAADLTGAAPNAAQVMKLTLAQLRGSLPETPVLVIPPFSSDRIDGLAGYDRRIASAADAFAMMEAPEVPAWMSQPGRAQGHSPTAAGDRYLANALMSELRSLGAAP